MRYACMLAFLLLPRTAWADDPDPFPTRSTDVVESENGVAITINEHSFGPYSVPASAIVFDDTKTHFAFIQAITSHRWMLVIDGVETRYQGPELMDNVRFTPTGAVRFDQYWGKRLQTLQVNVPGPTSPSPSSAK